MKISLLTIETARPNWFVAVSDIYQEKLSKFVPFSIQRIKSRGLSRSSSEEKRELESQDLLKKIDRSDFVVLFDEQGKSLTTQAFCKQLVQKIEGGVKSVVFVVGGAYGASDELKARANATWKLSDLTMNHLVAQLVGLEQIYRTMTIWKGVPYHND